MDKDRKKRLADFFSWVSANIKGDEKGEAQVYLDRLFQAFGHAGVREAGATLEERISKAEGKGKSFADLVWKPIVLIEMKKRGEDLTRHFRQAFDYWTRLVPGRPRFVILCNFDEFWVYDFDTQIDSPLDRVKLSELPTRWGALAFLFAKPEKPTFGNDQVAVTRKAADQLALCYNKLTDKNRLGGTLEQPLVQHFILQILVSLFAEDIGLLPRYMVTQLLDNCKTKQDSYDLIGGLFEAMNTREKTSDDRYQEVDYFNGGLFARPARVALRIDELDLLKAAAKEDWSKVRPEIFGTLFEHSLGKEVRHAYGAHFTHPTDIMKIVGPTIVEPWSQLIEGADTLKRLRALWQRMQEYTVFDPACGSGNFLYLAYRELKRLEARLLERMAELSGDYDATQRVFGFVSARQFYGMDINPFAIELAKVTMMIARKLAIDELHVTERALPLDNLDDNFRAVDALVDEMGNPTQWPQTDVIIGNPPFLGAKLLKPERGADYVDGIRRAYPQVPGMADYCVYWIRRAHDQIQECTSEDFISGRVGLVGTQNIRNNQSRVGGLDYVVDSGTIIEAVENQPWSGEANVNVSIVNWIKTKTPSLLPRDRKLWFKVDLQSGAKKTDGKQNKILSKSYDIDLRLCGNINSSLSDRVDVSIAKTLRCNTEPQRCFQGVIAGYEGFIISKEKAKELINLDKSSAECIYPFLIGRDLVTGNGEPSRYVIDLGGLTMIDAQSHTLAFKHLRETVLNPIREKAEPGVSHDPGRKAHLNKWWEMWRPRPEMLATLSTLNRYIACSDTTKRPIFEFVSTSIRADHKIRVFAFNDDYSYGILQSFMHWLWFVTKCSKLTERFNYTSSSVFDPFPWPQFPESTKIKAVADAGREVRRLHAISLTKLQGGFRALYRTLEMPGKDPLKEAHVKLNAAVMAAYGFSPKKDLLAQLLSLNLEVARREQAKEPVTAPGIPPEYPEPSRLVTDDCIKAV